MRGRLRAAHRRRPGRGIFAAALLAAAIAAPAAFGVPHPVIYGRTFTLSGAVPSKNAGETVQVLAREYGQAKFGRVASVTTTSGGDWLYTARPTITTTYLAAWKGTMTESVTADVTPRLDLSLHHGILTATARSGRQLRGHAVTVQIRRTGAPWHYARRLVLDASGNARVPFTVPTGRSELRLYMPKREAGPGYAAGYSGVLVYHKS